MSKYIRNFFSSLFLLQYSPMVTKRLIAAIIDLMAGYIIVTFITKGQYYVPGLIIAVMSLAIQFTPYIGKILRKNLHLAHLNIMILITTIIDTLITIYFLAGHLDIATFVILMHITWIVTSGSDYALKKTIVAYIEKGLPGFELKNNQTISNMSMDMDLTITKFMMLVYVFIFIAIFSVGGWSLDTFTNPDMEIMYGLPYLFIVFNTGLGLYLIYMLIQDYDKMNVLLPLEFERANPENEKVEELKELLANAREVIKNMEIKTLKEIEKRHETEKTKMNHIEMLLIDIEEKLKTK